MWHFGHAKNIYRNFLNLIKQSANLVEKFVWSVWKICLCLELKMRFKIFLNLFQMCGFELKTLFVTFFNNFNQNFKNYRYTNKFSTQYKKI